MATPLLPLLLQADSSYALDISYGVSMIGQVLVSVCLLWDTLGGHTTELL